MGENTPTSQGARVNELEKRQAVFDVRMDNVVEKLGAVAVSLSSINLQFDSFFKLADSRYAGKRVEKWLDRIAWAVIGTVLLALLSLLLPKSAAALMAFMNPYA